jgi:hypothetical protein
MLEVVALTEENMPQLWAYVRSQLLRVEGRNGCATLPEEAFFSWKSGFSMIYVLMWDRRLAGVVVFQNTKTDDKKNELWIWAMSFDGVAGKEQLLEVNEWLKFAARAVGASSVGMKSSRKGWQRFLKEYGWEPALIEYKLEVNDGQ